jgi:hypothetical protein
VVENKWLFKCPTCKTVMAIITTELDPKHIHQAPPCPCGKSRMVNMNSDEYAYGKF